MKLCRLIPAVVASLFSMSLAGLAGDMSALNWKWIFVNDLTSGRTLKQFGSRMEGGLLLGARARRASSCRAGRINRSCPL